MQMREHFMRSAIALAIENIEAGRGGPFGCVIVRDNQIVGEGTNCVTSTNDPTAHAEVIAIRNACRKLGSWQLTGCDIYSSCEPCPMCIGAIYWARASRLYFAASSSDAASLGFDDLFIYEQLKVTPANRRIPMIPIMRDEALEAFSLWQHTAAKVAY